MKEMLLSEEFSKYRQIVIKPGALVIKQMWGGKSPDYCLGATDMLKAILKIPSQTKVSKKAEEKISRMINEDFKKVELSILKDLMREE